MTVQNALPGIDVDAIQPIDPSHEAARQLFEQVLADVDSLFKDDYLGLMREGWYWRDAAYIAWKSVPRALREPQNEDAFCEMVGISRRGMVGRRRKNPAIDLRIAKGVVANSLLENMDEVTEALIESAANPSYKHHPDRKLFLEMSGAYTPKQDLNLTAQAKRPEELSEDDLRRQAMLGEGGAE